MLHGSRTSRAIITIGLVITVIAMGGCSSDDMGAADGAEQTIGMDDSVDQGSSDVDPDADFDDPGLDDPGFDKPDMPAGNGKSLPDEWPANVPVPDGLVIQGSNAFDMDDELKVGFRARVSMSLSKLDDHFRNLDGWVPAQDPVDPDTEAVELNYVSDDESQILSLLVQNLGSGLDVNASYTQYKDVD